MPADITGTEILSETEEGRRMQFVRGPIFANMILADEINRTPPKTQSALLEAMQEHQVTAAGVRHPLPEPFFVLATQNPIEMEGTYPLPEAQLDRFMFMVHVGYPSKDEEREILRRTTGGESELPKKVVGGPELLELQKAVRGIAIADHVYDYVLALTRGTRVRSDSQLAFLREWVTWGAGPRASQFLVLGAKANAALAGRKHVAIEDVKKVVHPVLRHRIVTNFSAAAEGITSDIIIDRLVNETAPAEGVGVGVPGIPASKS
jgi:MoxR-like ATPase